jgi:hypothetical protein
MEIQTMQLLPSGLFLATLATVAALTASPGAVPPQASDSPRAIVERASHDFGNAEEGARLVQKFSIRNAGGSALTVTRMSMTVRGMTARVTPTILPGTEVALTVEWDTAGAKGPVEGKAVLDVNDPVTPQLSFTLTAVVKQAIEFLPYQAVFASVYQGEPGHRTVRVVNNREQPFAVSRLEQQGDHFEASIRPVEAGRVYELQVTVPASVPSGRYTEAVFLYTDDPKMPRHMVPVNIIVKPELSISPEAVDFGRVSLKELATNPSAMNLLRQTLIVRKRAGKFSIASLSSDVPGVTALKSPDGHISSDAFRIDVVLVKDRLQAGHIDGSIRIRTNDVRVPELVVPVRGVIE